MSDVVEPFVLSVRDACTFTSLSKATLNRLVQKGLLNKYHVGGKALFRVVDLKRIVEGKDSNRSTNGGV